MTRPALRRLLATLILLALGVSVASIWRDELLHGLKLRLPNPLERRATLDRRSAHHLFDLDRIGATHRYDPVALLLPKPDQSSTWDWEEHPEGAIVLRTNDVGMREDTPLARAKRGVRVLVAGDSHTAGLVPNAQSFANLVEKRLAADPRFPSPEVLNAGVPYTGPSCYLGVLEKYLDLDLDAFVAVLFTGNDFADELRLRLLLDGWSLPGGDAAYRRRLDEATASFPEPVYQGLNQAYRLKHFPGEATRSLELAVEAFLRMNALCRERDVRFLAVVLPTKADVDQGDDEERQAELRRLLGLSVEELGANRRLGLAFVQALRDEGIACLDPYEAMRAHAAPLFWRRDYHLGLAGHELLAQLLGDELLERL